MCAVNWQMLLEYLKVFLSWPPVALAIAILLILKFRGAIDDFLKRLVEGDFFGQKFKAVAPTQQPESIRAGEDRLTLAVEAAAPPSAQEQAVDQLPPELAGDPMAPAAVAFVRDNPAQTVIEYKRLWNAYNAERLFARIYGTQIALLEYLASRPEEWVPLTVLAQFHDEFLQTASGSEYQLRDYVNFLVGFDVISVHGPENALVYRITQQGVEFLSYIKSNYPLNWNQRAF